MQFAAHANVQGTENGHADFHQCTPLPGHETALYDTASPTHRGGCAAASAATLDYEAPAELPLPPLPSLPPAHPPASSGAGADGYISGAFKRTPRPREHAATSATSTTTVVMSATPASTPASRWMAKPANNRVEYESAKNESRYDFADLNPVDEVGVLLAFKALVCPNGDAVADAESLPDWNWAKLQQVCGHFLQP